MAHTGIVQEVTPTSNRTLQNNGLGRDPTLYRKYDFIFIFLLL